MREYANAVPQTGLKPFAYCCALCNRVFHSSEWIGIHDPRICEECKTQEESYAVCRLCGDPVARERELCEKCREFVLAHGGVQ